MAEKQPNRQPGGDKGAWFASTSWTLISAAKQEDSSRAREALNQLCQAYWYPLYAFVRRRGYGPHDAEDLTQAFFYHLLQSDFLGGVDRRKGKFRSFLLGSVKRFLEKEREYRQAAKRGGGKTILSLDRDAAEGRFALALASNLSPDDKFDHDWATMIIQHGQARLAGELSATGKEALFKRLKVFLSSKAGLGDYRVLAAEMRMTPDAVAVAVHRLRHRYRELIRDELAQTVASPADLESEMRHFLNLLAGS